MGTMRGAVEEIHEVVSYLLMGVVGVHVVGVILASVMHKENYALGMVTGLKRAAPGDALARPYALAALVLVAAVGAGTAYFLAGFDWGSMAFAAPGTGLTVQLAEPEDGEGSHERHDDD